MVYAFEGKAPRASHGEFYVAPSADVIGDVRFGDRASVWFGAVVRADDDFIEIGEGSNVQDGSIIHIEQGMPVIIGKNTSLGHAVIVHSCRIGNESLIGNGAIVLDGAHIGDHCVIASGALVTPNAKIPDGSVVMGSPGRVVRSVVEKDLSLIRRAAQHYQARAIQYRDGLRAIRPNQ